jgi:hypothetical protein
MVSASAEFMTPREAGEKIVGYWSIGFTCRSIAVLMVCSNVMLTTAEVGVIIRMLIDERTENRDPKPGEAIWR